MAACSGGDLVLPNADDGVQIRVVDGDGQRGSVGEPLTAPVIVEVTDAAGQPMEGVTVEFALTSAGTGAEIAPASARTSDDGRAQAHILLGDKVGLQTGEARVIVEGGPAPITSFSALAVAQDEPPASPPSNQAPQAEFEIDCDELRCSFTDQSTDPDGSIETRQWDFGDGGSSTQRNPSHTYQSAGQFDVVLAVTDDDGATNSRTRTAETEAPTTPPPPSNKAPRAEFDVACQDLRCTFTDRSTDEDGNIASRQWDFGDGATSSERNPAHSYASAGRYQVLLVVTDSDGASDRRTRTAQPSSPAPPPPSNQPPDAEFEVTCQELRCTFVDRSEDSDGSLATWQWTFGDGSTSSARNPSHTYEAPGNYDVLLVVTDDDGAADTRTHSVRVDQPPPPPPPPPPPGNKPPKADFDVHCTGLTCVFEDKSKDDDGTIVSWNWNFGDGGTSSERNPVHSYDSKGHRDVLLTVTDDDGATNTKKRKADPK